MRRLFSYWFQVFASLLFFSLGLKAQADLTTIPLKKYNFGQLSIGHQASYFYDSTGERSAGEVADIPFLPEEAFNFTDQKYWVSWGNHLMDQS